jgi:hypothetical protein
MERAIASTLGTLATALALAATTGCVASGGDESIIVLRNVLGGSSTGGCTFTSQESEVGLSQGTLDVQRGTGYLFGAQLKSRITSLTGQEDQRTIFTSGANVDIAFPSTTVFSDAELADFKAANLLHFKSPFTVPLRPNGIVTDIPFVLIPGDLAVKLQAKLGFTSVVADASFRIVGDLAGGEVTSQTFHYPVTILAAGLVLDAGECALLSSSFMARVGNVCNPGQDGVVDCCSDARGAQICPAVGTKTGFTGASGE